MQTPGTSGRTYDVERRAYHAARPGFRIVEMQIGPTQTVPWHYHTDTQDAFYVISGVIRLHMRAPDDDVILEPGQVHTVCPRRPHAVENAGETSATFLILQGIGGHDFIAIA